MQQEEPRPSRSLMGQDELEQLAQDVGVDVDRKPRLRRRVTTWGAVAVTCAVAALWFRVIELPALPAMPYAPGNDEVDAESQVPTSQAERGEVGGSAAGQLDVTVLPIAGRSTRTIEEMALDELCSRRGETTPKAIYASMLDAQGFWARLWSPIAEDEVVVAWGELEALCEARENMAQGAEFIVSIDAIDARVATIQGNSCGPEFSVSWSYHLDRVKNAETLEEAQKALRMIDRSLSYYEDIERDTCALRAQRDGELEHLRAEFRNDFSRRTVAPALAAVRGDDIQAGELCRVAIANNYSLARESRLDPSIVANCPNTFSIALPSATRGAEMRAYIGSDVVPLTRWVWRPGWEVPRSAAIARLVNAVCSDRLTHNRDRAYQVFTANLPQWERRGEQQRIRYEEIFNETADAAGGSACTDENGEVLWSIAQRVIDKRHRDERAALEREATEQFRDSFGRLTYVGKHLQDRIYLERIYELEYYPTDGSFVDDPEVVADLLEQWDRILDREDNQAFKLAMAHLQADAQIRVAAQAARASIENAREEARTRRYEADRAYEAKMVEIRSKREGGFLGSVLGAAASVLGGGFAKGVVDLVFPGETTTEDNQ